MADQSFGWGILGCGGIAGQFARGLTSVPGAHLAGVGSRSKEKSEEFGAKHGAVKCHGSYEELVNDPDVKAIYIATPHPMHVGHMKLCLSAGKATLCEKPFTINASEAAEAITLARSEKVFLMEAMWSRYFPLMAKLREIIAEGQIGALRMIHADFGFRTGFDAKSRAFAPELGGGGLLDVGVYPISLASMLLGTPTDVTGLAEIGETGVDEQAAMVLKYKGNELALLSTGVRTNTPQEAYIMGTDGQIHIHAPWWKPSKMTVSRHGKAEELEIPFEGNGYNYEAIEVMNCVRDGLLESPTMPLDESLEIMKSMDKLRAQWGIKYPME